MDQFTDFDYFRVPGSRNPIAGTGACDKFHGNGGHEDTDAFVQDPVEEVRSKDTAHRIGRNWTFHGLGSEANQDRVRRLVQIGKETTETVETAHQEEHQLRRPGQYPWTDPCGTTGDFQDPNT